MKESLTAATSATTDAAAMKQNPTQRRRRQRQEENLPGSDGARDGMSSSSFYEHVVWNGQLGNLRLTSTHIVLEAQQQISETEGSSNSTEAAAAAVNDVGELPLQQPQKLEEIPWGNIHKIEAMQDEDSEAGAYVRLHLKHGEAVDLKFPDEQVVFFQGEKEEEAYSSEPPPQPLLIQHIVDALNSKFRDHLHRQRPEEESSVAHEKSLDLNNNQASSLGQVEQDKSVKFHTENEREYSDSIQRNLSSLGGLDKRENSRQSLGQVEQEQCQNSQAQTEAQHDLQEKISERETTNAIIAPANNNTVHSQHNFRVKHEESDHSQQQDKRQHVPQEDINENETTNTTSLPPNIIPLQSTMSFPSPIAATYGDDTTNGNDNNDDNDNAEDRPLLLASLMERLQQMEERERIHHSRVVDLEAQLSRLQQQKFLMGQEDRNAKPSAALGGCSSANGIRKEMSLETTPMLSPKGFSNNNDSDDGHGDRDRNMLSPTPLLASPRVQFMGSAKSNDGSDPSLNQTNDYQHHHHASRHSSEVETELAQLRNKLSLRTSTVTGKEPFATTLPGDSYSFLMIAPICSVPFGVGVFVVAVQMTVYTLMAESMLAQQAYNNTLGVPPNVYMLVKVVQFMALLIAVVTQTDLVKGLDNIRVRNSSSFWRSFPHASQRKLVFCIATQCLQGCLGLMTSFFLIIQSETIYDLLLNFTALEFVGQLDEAFFVLSSYGFAGKACQIATRAIEGTTYYVHTKVHRFKKILLFSVIFAVMIAGWSGVIRRQNTGRYMCNTLMVQFGDDLRPELATFSGLYDQEPSAYITDARNHHFRYTDRATKTAVFAYCVQNATWSFHYDMELDLESYDPCKDWVVRSSNTYAYDIVTAAQLNWFVRNDFGHEIFLDPFVLFCGDCGKGSNDCNGEFMPFFVCVCLGPDGRSDFLIGVNNI